MEDQNKAKLSYNRKKRLFENGSSKKRRFGFVSINVNIKNENDLIAEVNKIF